MADITNELDWRLPSTTHTRAQALLAKLKANATNPVTNVTNPVTINRPDWRMPNIVQETPTIDTAGKYEGIQTRNKSMQPRSLESVERPYITRKTPEGKSFQWRPSDEEWSMMTVAEKIRYQEKPEDWLKEKSGWESQRGTVAGINELAKNMFGVNPKTSLYDVRNTTPEGRTAQLYGAASNALNILPAPEIKPIAKAVWKGADYVAPGVADAAERLAKTVGESAPAQAIKRFANTPLGRPLSEQSGKIGKEVAGEGAKQADQTGFIAAFSEIGQNLGKEMRKADLGNIDKRISELRIKYPQLTQSQIDATPLGKQRLKLIDDISTLSKTTTEGAEDITEQFKSAQEALPNLKEERVFTSAERQGIIDRGYNPDTVGYKEGKGILDQPIPSAVKPAEKMGNETIMRNLMMPGDGQPGPSDWPGGITYRDNTGKPIATVSIIDGKIANAVSDPNMPRELRQQVSTAMRQRLKELGVQTGNVENMTQQGTNAAKKFNKAANVSSDVDSNWNKTRQFVDKWRKEKPLFTAEQQFKINDKDRGYAEYIDKYFDELPGDIQDFWRKQKIFDLETQELNLAAETGVRGGHVWQVRGQTDQFLDAGTGGGNIPPAKPPTATGAIPPIEPKKPEFAGNIRLSKFDPEMHDDLLKATESDAFVQARRRGIRSHEDTLEAAQGIAAKTGGDPNKIAKSLGEAYNAEEAKAIDGMLTAADDELRKLRELVSNPATDNTGNRLRLASQQKKVAHFIALATSSRAEAGRALESYKIFNKAIKSNDRILMEKVLKQAGGADQTAEFMKLAQGIDWNDPIAVNNLIRQLNKPKWWQYPHEIYINSILSGPRTNLVNALTTGIYTAKEPLDTITSALLDIPMSVGRKGGRARYTGEAWAELASLKTGFTDGLRSSWKTIRDGIPADAIEKYEFRPSAFTGKLGRAINIPTNIMEATDQFFKGINYRMAVSKLSYREVKKAGVVGKTKFADDLAKLIANPTDEIMEEAHQITLERLFRRQAGKTTQALMNVRESQPVLKFLLPFIRTPVNLLKVGLETSPLGIFNPKLIKNIATRNPQAAEQLAKVALGSLFAGGLYLYAKDGKITGAAPTTEAKRDQFYREGKQAYSIKIGDTWVSYQRLEPFNQTFTQIAALVEASEADDKDIVGKAGQVTNTIAKNFVSQSYMSGIADIMDAIAEPERYGSGVINRMATGMLVPYSSFTRTVAQTADTTIRKPESLLESLKASIPGLSQQVPARLNAFGETTQRETPAFFPINYTTEIETALNKELADTDTGIGYVSGKVGSISLNNKEESEYQQVVGGIIKSALEKLISSPEYAGLTKAERERMLSSAITKARSLGKDEYIKSSSIVDPKVGDSDEVLQARNDLTRVKSYLNALTPVTNDNARTLIGNVLRANDPGLDVALILNGYKDKAKTEEGNALLLTRRNGGIEEYANPLSDAEIQKVVDTVNPYYAVEDYVWGKYGGAEIKAISESLAKLDSTKEKQILYKHPMGPTILKARTEIDTYKKQMAAKNQLLAYYLKTYR
jgi:hypothetical protein